ncbi:MAG: HAD-IIB family hydrolase, partial [Pseudomonadota bacterium]
MKKTINNNLIKRQGGTDRTQLLIFTDLDGTLLDHYTYSFDPAQEALKKISAAKIPLIICTSKTRAEIEVWREKLNNNDPFISENGGAIFFPNEGGASDLKKCLDDHDRYDIVELGMPYSELIIHFRRLKGIFEERIRGFSEMDASEVARLTGLPTEEAELAMRREYTEPFIFDGDEAGIKRLQESVQTLRLTLTRGGRFFHLLGGNDKGKAVRIVTERYKRSFIRVRSVAIGDSYNDLPML